MRWTKSGGYMITVLKGVRKLIVTVCGIAGVVIYGLNSAADANIIVGAIVFISAGHQAAQTYLDRKRGGAE